MKIRPNVRRLTVADVERAIGCAARDWEGRCYAVACDVTRSGLVAGRIVYGHWTGPIAASSPFASRRGIGFTHHAWILVDADSGLVFDPTRWVFEAVAPYLFVGEPPDGIADACVTCGLLSEEHGDSVGDIDGGVSGNCGDFRAPVWPYDEGGDSLRAAQMKPMPRLARGAKTFRIGLPVAVRNRLGLPSQPSAEQLFWLANLPYVVLYPDAKVVYRSLARIGRKALVPVDNWLRAEAES